jgi:hypothetical protein
MEVEQAPAAVTTTDDSRGPTYAPHNGKSNRQSLPKPPIRKTAVPIVDVGTKRKNQKEQDVIVFYFHAIL